VVPLVFKTSLGVVRSPEGSTPSLLRQDLLNTQNHRQLGPVFVPCKSNSFRVCPFYSPIL
jgi:hypothetical protein